MAHLPLNILHIGAVPLEPSAVGSTEATPVHKAQAQVAGCGLDEAEVLHPSIGAVKIYFPRSVTALVSFDSFPNVT